MSKSKPKNGKDFLAKVMQLLFDLSLEIRYVAMYNTGVLTSSSRSELEGASSSESDKYEELIVNPTLLTLLSQRGEIDCGGIEYVIIRYGKFFQLVQPINDGHVSIAFEADCHYEKLLPKIQKILKNN